MHFKNENDIKTYSNQYQQFHHNHQPTATATSSSTSSTDSGVIIIDNRTTIGNKKCNNSINTKSNNNNNNNHQEPTQQQSYNNNSNKNNTHKNATNSNVYNKTARIEIPNDKIDNNKTTTTTTAGTGTTGTTIKPDNNSSNKEFNQNIHADGDVDVDDDDEPNTNISRPKSINIENIINITKGKTEGQQHHHHHHRDHHDNHDRRLHNDCCNVTIEDDDSTKDATSNGSAAATSKHCSPTLSIRSTSISIVSIDENAIDSSIIDSDSEHEADAEGVHTNYVVKKLGQQTTYPAGSNELPNINKGLTVISQQISPNNLAMPPENVLNGGFCAPALPKLTNAAVGVSVGGNGGALTPTSPPPAPQIGSIALTNSTDVTFGDKHFYEGPVTIQQILIDRRDKWKADENGGHDNPMFAKESDYDASGSKANQKTPSQPETPYSFICKRKAIIITATIIVLTILIGVILLTTIKTKRKLNYGDGEDSRKNIPINSTIDKDNIGGGLILRLVARDGWLAQPPSGQRIPLDLPLRKVIVIATQTDICTTQAMCTHRVRFIQTFNIESQQNDDIIYNFLIGGDGNVYEGRGWDYRGAHLKGFNDETLSLAYIGTFREQSPNDKQMEVTKLLLDEGVRLEKLAPDYKIYAAKKFDPTSLATASAKALYDSFKNWPHWSD